MVSLSAAVVLLAGAVLVLAGTSASLPDPLRGRVLNWGARVASVGAFAWLVALCIELGKLYRS